MHPDAKAWFRRNTSSAADWSRADVTRAKAGRTVSVIIPARDEAETVGAIVASIVTNLMDGDAPLVDELLVVDSDSQDDTATVARAGGARVLATDAILPLIPPVAGKGEAMWRGLAATDGDFVVFVDADLRSFTPEYVVALLGPLMTDTNIRLVKAAYARPLVNHSGVRIGGGGRVTELVARPLLNLHWPELAGVAQPLAGEYAARRDTLEDVPFPCGYGVEIALLIDIAARWGINAIAQVDLGERLHRHQDQQRLGLMAAEIWQVALARLDPHGLLPRSGETLAQFTYGPQGLEVADHHVDVLARPPMREIRSASTATRR